MKHRFAFSLVVLAGVVLAGPGVHGAGLGAPAAGGGGTGNGAAAGGNGGSFGGGGGNSAGGGGAGSSFGGGGGGGGSRPSIVQPSTGGGGGGGAGHAVFERPSSSGGGFTGSAPVTQPPINKTPLRPYIPPAPGDPGDRGNPRGGGQSGAGFIPFSDDHHHRPTPAPAPTGHPGTASFPVAPATGADAPWRASSLNHPSSTPGSPGNGGGGRPWHPGRSGSGASAPSPGETFINSAAIVANAPLRASLDQRAGGVQAWEARRQNYWNQWAAQHAGQLDDFASQRQELWNRTREFRGNHWDQIQQRGDAWRQWRASMLNFRAQRGDEIRDGYRDAYCEWFTPGWFLRHRWWLNAYYVNYAVNPWWCWQGPGDFGGYSVIYNGAPPDAVTDDYGTDIVMNGDNVYVDGQDTGSAEAWRAQAIALANPAGMPPPPVPQGDNDPSITPLGVWALTAEETGNAVIFYQLAATRDGLITGTYSNILTGDSGPLIGSIDKKSQRLAFHAGNVTQTVVETNLNGLTRQQTAAYIHFGTTQTQEWMLVRMADPGVGGGGSNQ